VKSVGYTATIFNRFKSISTGNELYLWDYKVKRWVLNKKKTFYRIGMKFFLLNICLYDQGIKLEIFVNNKIKKII